MLPPIRRPRSAIQSGSRWEELAGYSLEANDNGGGHANGIAVPLILDTVAGRIRFVSTVTIFGTPVDITLSELAIEAFFPADAESAALLQTLSER